MGLDLLVCCVFAYWLVKHTPELVGETVAEWGYARRGEESPTAAARRVRLLEAGVDPAAGGAFNQFAGNLWRDFWLDRDQDRQRRRADRQADNVEEPAVEETVGWWTRLGTRVGERLDETVNRQANKWARRRTADRSSPPGDGPADVFGDEPTEPVVHASEQEPGATTNSAPEDVPSGDGERRPPIRVKATLGDPQAADSAYESTDGGTLLLLDDPFVDDMRERVNAVDAHADGQHTASNEPPELTQGEPMTDLATRPTVITGVISGSQEMAAINRQLEAATSAYVAQIAAIRRRIHAAGESTLATVQFAGRSSVVQRMAQAAEAAAASESAAKLCASEVGPLLLASKREFDKRNS